MIHDSGLKIVISASGSRGDVQPYIALGLALTVRGHNVSIATEERMKSLVDEFGLDYKYIGGDPTGVLHEPKAQKVLRDGSIMKLISLTKEWDKKFNKNDILDSYVTACSGADLIIASPLTMTQTYCVSEYLQCAWIPMILGPTLPTSEYPLWALASLVCCCSCLNKWTYSTAFKMLWKNEKTFINPWRTGKLGLPEMREASGIAGVLDRVQPPIIIACSPMISGPFGRIPADYPGNAFMHGFVFVPSTVDSSIDPALVQFINHDMLSPSPSDAGRPVIYFGFGSMPAPNPEELLRIAVQTCNIARCRAVLVAGWSQLDGPACLELVAESRATGTLFITNAVPHDWLFPRVSCIVHHCGVGTMAAALRSGVPQVPCPVMLDQHHNAKTVLRLGCCAGVLPFSQLSSRRLAGLLTRTLSSEAEGTVIRRCAQTCSEQIQRESSESLDKYCSIIEAYAAVTCQRRSLDPTSERHSTPSPSPSPVSMSPHSSGRQSGSQTAGSVSSPAFSRAASSTGVGGMHGKQVSVRASPSPAFSRAASVGPGGLLDLNASSEGVWRTNYSPIHPATSTAVTSSSKKPGLNEALIE